MTLPERLSMIALQRKRYAPDHSAKILAPHQMRVDDAASSEGADHAGDADLAEIGVDLDLRKDGAVRAHRVGGLRGGIHRAAAAGVDLGKTDAAQDVTVTFTAILVVAAGQAPAARAHPGAAP